MKIRGFLFEKEGGASTQLDVHCCRPARIQIRRGLGKHANAEFLSALTGVIDLANDPRAGSE